MTSVMVEVPQWIRYIVRPSHFQDHGMSQTKLESEHGPATKKRFGNPRVQFSPFFGVWQFFWISHLYKTSGSHHLSVGNRITQTNPQWTRPEARAQDTRRWSMGMMRRWGERVKRVRGVTFILSWVIFLGMKMEVPRF